MCFLLAVYSLFRKLISPLNCFDLIHSNANQPIYNNTLSLIYYWLQLFLYNIKLSTFIPLPDFSIRITLLSIFEKHLLRWWNAASLRIVRFPLWLHNVENFLCIFMKILHFYYKIWKPFNPVWFTPEMIVLGKLTKEDFKFITSSRTGYATN